MKEMMPDQRSSSRLNRQNLTMLGVRCEDRKSFENDNTIPTWGI